jgi:hypothetical protein
VIEAELLTVLNTLTEHDFHDAFKNGMSSGNGAYAGKGTTSRVMVAVGPKLVLDQMAAPVQEFTDGSFADVSDRAFIFRVKV